MDDPAIDPAVHDRALAGLRRLNCAARSHGPIAREVRRLAPAGGEIVLADIATGSGDVALAVASHLRTRGLGVTLVLHDMSGHALEQAQRRCEAAGFAVRCVQGDATANPLPMPEDIGIDVAMCSLFLHHLGEADAARVVANMRALSRVGLVVSDLRRSRTGLALAWLASRTLTRSPVVHVDSIRSVRAGWTMNEFSRLATMASLDGACIMGAWPERLIMTWRASGGSR